MHRGTSRDRTPSSYCTLGTDWQVHQAHPAEHVVLSQGGQGGGGGGFNPLGGMGGQMDFMKNKAKFQEDPDTGITFDDVAVSSQGPANLLACQR